MNGERGHGVGTEILPARPKRPAVLADARRRRAQVLAGQAVVDGAPRPSGEAGVGARVCEATEAFVLRRRVGGVRDPFDSALAGAADVLSDGAVGYRVGTEVRGHGVDERSRTLFRGREVGRRNSHRQALGDRRVSVGDE